VSKESRRRQRASQSPSADTTAGQGAPSAASASGTSGTRSSTSPSGSSRAGRRERSRSLAEPSFLQRYRSIIVAVAAVAVIGVVAVGVFAASSQPAYACSTEWVPDATSSPAANASPQPGYPQPDMGQGHVANGTAITYTYCPPASGRHYNGSQTGPISARVYGPDDVVLPQGWIHNLEHGALVVLYRGDSDGATDAGQAAMRAFFDSYPPSPVCGFQPGTSVGPVFARFDDMETPLAALVWGRVLPLDSLDTQAILQFDQTYGERTNPEKFCSPAPSTEPAASPAAS
jgi:Protein of unknown function (DUF3105)